MTTGTGTATLLMKRGSSGERSSENWGMTLEEGKRK